MDKHIVWSGELYHKASETVSAGSQWAVLMRESVHGPKRLELYRSYMDYSSNLPASFILNLGDMLHVERNLDPHHKISVPSYSSHYHWDKKRSSSSIEPPKYQFTITTERDAHIFSTRSSDESSFWVGKLNELLHGPPEQGVEYEFPVQVLPTPLSRSFSLYSSHVLKVSELDIRLYDATGTTPTSFVCPLGNIENVDHTAPRGVSPGVVSLHCSNVCGTSGHGGTITISTDSTADISRILNHRRMSSASPPTLSLPRPTTNSSVTTHYNVSPHPQLHSLTHYHHMTSLDSKLHPYTSPRSTSPSSINVPSCGQFQHAHVSVVKSLPPVTSIGLVKQRRVQESSSSSDSEDDDETVHVSAKQLERIHSDRRISGGDFESVASWVRCKRDSLGRVNSFPNIQPSLNESGGVDLQQKSHCLPQPVSSVAVSLRNSGNSKFAQRRYNLRRSSSLGNSLNEDQVYIASGDKRKEDAPGAHDSLIFNNVYEQPDSGSWQSPMSVSGDSEQQAQATDSSLHNYESIKEFRLERQPMSIESDPDYDYVKDRILGVRGLPVQPRPLDQLAAAPYSSDEEENYYY